MKKVLLASCIAAISATASASVFLPNIGVDGWNTDGEYFRAAAFSQGYLTASDVKNHTINPAFALDLMESAEARMDTDGDFSAGAFSTLFGQNLGVYFGRPTDDSFMYRVDVDGDGSVFTDLNSDGDHSDEELDNQLNVSGRLPPSNILDAYWAADIGAGQLGIRLNYRASGHGSNTELTDEDTDVTTDFGFQELHTTAGFISYSMPLEATFTVGIPFGEYSMVDKNDTANTKDEVKGEIDSGLRWGSTVKYTLSDSGQGKTVVSGFMGSSSANYSSTNKEKVSGTVNSDMDFIQEYFTIGIVGSHATVVNNRTRLVASAGLTRQSGKIGNVNHPANSPDEPNHDTYAWYRLPVAVGVEFRKSEKTDLIASVSSDLYNSYSEERFVDNAGDAEEASNFYNRWYAPNTDVEFGLSYQATQRLDTKFVINKSLFRFGLDRGLTTTAQFSYDF